MPISLLPASAKAFSARGKPNVVLGPRAETWLTHTLKRVNKTKRPLNNVSQHTSCLTDLLSGESAIWSLASIMVTNAPASELRKDDDPMVEAFANYQFLHLEGYVILVDMVHNHEVGFKLTQDTIDTLVDYHKKISSKDAAAEYNYDWPEKERHLVKLQEDFKQAINSFVYKTKSTALEGLEEDGAGELLQFRAREVKDAINALFKPLLPPPPKIEDLIVPGMVAGSWYQTNYYCQYQGYYPPQSQYISRPMPMEQWRTLGSSPSPEPSHHSETQSVPSPWSQPAQPIHYQQTHLPSPTPSYSQPYTCSDQYQSVPAFSPVQPLPLPSSLISQQCGSSMGSSYSNYYSPYSDMPLTPQCAF